jgi:hypothetical protein
LKLKSKISAKGAKNTIKKSCGRSNFWGFTGGRKVIFFQRGKGDILFSDRYGLWTFLPSTTKLKNKIKKT